jgi:outer membrane protein OmpA-like peptidoglycan-associated protein
MVDYPTRADRIGARAAIRILSNTALLLALAGCNPIDTYRHWTGISANDPNPATTPNTKNLAAGDARSYPNLATVPPPPSQALTAAELDKLTQSLIADRTNAKYTSEHLEAQFNEAATPPPPPPPAPAPGTANPQSPSPAAPGSPGPAAPAPASPGGAMAAASPPAAGAAKSPPAAPGAAVASTASASPAPGGQGGRKSGQPPEPGPLESSLQSPQIASLPQPQQNQPAPPPPSELSLPPVSGKSTAAGAGAHLPAPPAVAPMPAAIGSAQFQPAPPPPNLASTTPTRTAMASPAGKLPKPAPATPAFAKIADIAFPGEETKLGDAERQTLDKLVPRYRAKPGLVKVVGYAGLGTTATEQLNSYRTALDRAQAVAKELAQAGIPANKISVEAAPSGSDSGPGRAEILLQP